MAQSSALTAVLSFLIVSLVGSMIFFFVSPPYSYLLFALFFLLVIVIATSSLGSAFISKIHLRVSIMKIQMFFFVATLVLLVVQLAEIHLGLIGGFLYVVVYVFALGTSVLSILKFKSIFSRIEFVALSYSLSLALLSIIGTITLILPFSLRGPSTSLTIAFLSFVSILVGIKEKRTKVSDQYVLIIKNGELVLLLIISIFIFFYLNLYPALSNILGHDIFRNFLQGLFYTEDRLGDFYITSQLYPLFSIYQSSLFYIIGPSVEVFQTIMIFLNIFVILSFYVMASQYLKRYGDLVPSVATLIWATFSGFGWLNFLMQEIKVPNASMMSLINQSDVLSYGDITWRRLFFYLSMEVTISLVFIVLYLLARNDLRKNTKVVLMTLVMTPLSLMHPYGSLLLFVVFLCYAVIGSVEQSPQLKYGALSLILASFASLGLTCILYIVAPTYFPLDFLRFMLNVFVGLVLIAIVSVKGFLPKRLNSAIIKIMTRRNIFSVATVVLFFYLSCLLFWLNGNVTFNFVELDLFGYVPWFMYPVKLGIIGILAIVSVYFLLTDSQHSHRELGIMLASALLLIFIARSTSAIQMQYTSEFTFNTGSWLSKSITNILLSLREERMFELLKVPLAMIASTVFAESVLNKIKKNNNLLNKLAVLGLISLLLISGISSTILGFEYYKDQVKVNQPSQAELNILNEMRNQVYQNGKSIILGLETPYAYLDSTGAIALLTESPAAWISKSPEFPLFVTRYSLTTPTYIYIDKARDTQELSNDSGNYLGHLYGIAQDYLENQEAEIKTIGNGSITTPNSNTALILPYIPSLNMIQKPYYQEESNSSIELALFFEKSMELFNFYKEPILYNNIQVNGSAFFRGTNDSYIRINGTETNPEKISIELDFRPLNLTKYQVLVSKFEVGTPPKKSWEVVQYGKRIGFKISPDGNREEILLTPEILENDTEYIIRCEYDGNFMKIFVNDVIITSQPYHEGIFKSDTDIVIGGELYNGKPSGFSRIAVKYVLVSSDFASDTEPIFNAYDVLSSAQINYTTVLSSDNCLGKYKTLILPYDDITTNRLLSEIESGNETTAKNIIILNTNGYGPLLNLFGNLSSETFYANSSLSKKYSAMQPSIEMRTIKPYDGIEVKASYVDGSHSSPFVMEKSLGNFTLVYANVYPLIKPNLLSYYTAFQNLGEALNDYVAIYDNATVSPWFNEPSLMFTGFQANGSIQVLSYSIASVKLSAKNTLNISSGALKRILANVTDLNFEGFDEIQINSPSIALQKGYGFYTTLTAYNPSITLQGNRTADITVYNNKLEGQRISMDVVGNMTFLIRQPEVSLDGEIDFHGFYFMHPPIIYTDGRNITLQGKMQFKVYASDESTIALPYRLDSPINVRYEPPLVTFNEIQSLSPILPNIVVVTIFATIILLVQLLGRKEKHVIQ